MPYCVSNCIQLYGIFMNPSRSTRSGSSSTTRIIWNVELTRRSSISPSDTVIPYEMTKHNRESRATIVPKLWSAVPIQTCTYLHSSNRITAAPSLQAGDWTAIGRPRCPERGKSLPVDKFEILRAPARIRLGWGIL